MGGVIRFRTWRAWLTDDLAICVGFSHFAHGFIISEKGEFIQPSPLTPLSPVPSFASLELGKGSEMTFLLFSIFRLSLALARHRTPSGLSRPPRSHLAFRELKTNKVKKSFLTRFRFRLLRHRTLRGQQLQILRPVVVCAVSDAKTWRKVKMKNPRAEHLEWNREMVN